MTLAVEHGQAEIARILLDSGAEVDERTRLTELEEPTVTWGMPLWYASLAGNAEITKLLLERGADPNANVYASGWPLRNAWHHEPVKQLLLAAGAKIQPYMISEEHDVAEARTLLESGPDEEVVNELAWSAADHGCPAILELALPHLPWKMDDERWHWLLMQPIRGASSGSEDNDAFFACMALLLRHGVDPNLARKGQTTLHYAAGRHGSVGEEDRARFARMLLDAGARFDLRDDILQSTALGWACRWGRRAMAELLIARGAPVNESDAEPWATPIAWAEKGKHQDVIELLLAHGAARVS